MNASSDLEARSGDVFAIFPGCSTPILLRPTDKDSYFRVIGESYVQGVMEGEMFPMIRDGHYDLREISLC